MKKIGLLALALVLALGTLGIGYALWYEVLYIEGTVETGTLEAEWSLEGYGDYEEKDWVSYVDAYICGDVLYVHVYNAYPCVTYYVNFNVENTGTIPFHICPLQCTGSYGYGYGFPGTILITNLSGEQVHPGYQNAVFGDIEIHLENYAEEGANYTFSCKLPVVQYNEDCSMLPTPLPDWEP